MKKHQKHENDTAEPQDEADISSLIIEMHEKLVYLEKKIDILIAQSQNRSSEERYEPKQPQRFERPHRQEETRYDGEFKPRALHKATCADCGNECEVPFRPSGERPIYCRECFPRHRAPAAYTGKSTFRPRGGERHFDERPAGGGRRFDKRKKPFFKKKRMD